MLTAKTQAAQTYLPLITGKDGEIRASKPKDGNAAYVWRMVAFSVSTISRHHCMPVTADFDVVVPEEFCIAIPFEWLDEQVRRTERTPSDIEFCRREAGSVSAYHVARWHRYGRRKHFIKTVLDPIVNEIVDSVPVTRQAGTMRWARAYGVA
jgi:hypothetical protein